MTITAHRRSDRSSVAKLKASFLQRRRRGTLSRKNRRPGDGRRLHLESLESRLVLNAAFPEFVDPNPAPGNDFGATVVPLSSGNIVITSPFDDAGAVNAGAVYLFNGASGDLISTLTGSSANDNVGSDGVTALTSGNYVVVSPFWDNGGVANAGAVTFGNGTSGIAGEVTAANSALGETANTNLQTAVADDVNGYFFGRFLYEDGGRLRVGSLTTGFAVASLQATLAGGILTVTDIGNGVHGKDNNLTIKRSGTNLVVEDAAEQFVAAPPGGTLSNGNRTLSVPLADVASLRVDAAGGSDVLTVDYRQPSEFFALAGGIEFVGGVGDSDELVVQGGGVFAQLSSDTSLLSDLTVDTFVGASHTVISSSGIESASVLDMTDLDVKGLLAVGAATLRLDTQGDANLGELTTIAGGTISGAVALSAGDEISGHGTVSGTVFAGEGSRITASGDLCLGLGRVVDRFS